MRSESILFFSATQLITMFGFSNEAIIALVAIAASAVVVKAIADQRRVEMVSWVTIFAAVASAVVFPWMVQAEEARGADFMMELTYRGRRIQGKAIRWSDNDVKFVGRDGRLWEFAANEASDMKKLSPKFQPYSAAQMRGQLMKEFGKKFEVTGTGHYLVVHPAGQKDRWALRFEKIYRAFTQYFTARGFQIRKPHYPLVAIAFPTKHEFYRHAAATGSKLGPGVLGYYSPVTNRILVYDVTASTGTPEDWHVNNETIIHEAAHQVAFNVGVHSRIRMPPRWLAEGLGTMFEAPGVWGSRRHHSKKERLNRQRLERFQVHLAKRKPGFLAEFISSDRVFQVNPDKAYAEAWALTFFLAETRPRQYAKFMTMTERGSGGFGDPPSERLHVFSEVFGKDLRMLEAHYLRYFRDLAKTL